MARVVGKTPFVRCLQGEHPSPEAFVFLNGVNQNVIGLSPT